jgi:hypothetical protein
MPSAVTASSFLAPDLFFIYVGPGAMPDADLERILGQLTSADAGVTLRVMAYNSGTLDGAQRQLVGSRLKGRSLTSAVIVDSAVARGIITAIGWVIGGVKAFSPAQAASAYDYVRLSEAEVSLVTRALSEARSLAA